MHKETGDCVCTKEMDLSFLSSEERNRCFVEVKVLQQLPAHSNIVGFREAFCTHDLDEGLHTLILVLEYVDGGDLAQCLRVSSMTEENARLLFTELVKGVSHLHRHHIVHRDLKSDNVFRFQSGRVVVGDFGTARQLLSTAGANQALKDQDFTSTVVGSPLYMSPELLEGKLHGFATDIWSLGCVLYELLSGGRPAFGAASYPGVVFRITRGQYDPLDAGQVSKEARDLVATMLEKEPQNRPSITKVLQSAWLETGAGTRLKNEDAFDPKLSPTPTVMPTKCQEKVAEPYNSEIIAPGTFTTIPPPAPIGIKSADTSLEVTAPRNQKRVIRRNNYSLRKRNNLLQSRVASPLIWLDEQPPPPPALPTRHSYAAALSMPFKHFHEQQRNLSEQPTTELEIRGVRLAGSVEPH